jgi:hypothetical protein
MKGALLAGAVSEILLVAGITCIGFEFIATLGHFGIPACVDPYPIFGCPVFAPFYGMVVLFGLVLLIAAAVGFLFTLRLYQRI